MLEDPSRSILLSCALEPSGDLSGSLPLLWLRTTPLRLVDAKAVVVSQMSASLMGDEEYVLPVLLDAVLFDGLQTLNNLPRSLFLLSADALESSLHEVPNTGLDEGPSAGSDGVADAGLGSDPPVELSPT
jgi:hypothetical protein